MELSAVKHCFWHGQSHEVSSGELCNGLPFLQLECDTLFCGYNRTVPGEHPARPESNNAAPGTEVHEAHEAAGDDAVQLTAATDNHEDENGPSNTAGDSLFHWAQTCSTLICVDYIAELSKPLSPYLQAWMLDTSMRLDICDAF